MSSSAKRIELRETKAELYEGARRRDIEGRSKMSTAELAKAHD